MEMWSWFCFARWSLSGMPKQSRHSHAFLYRCLMLSQFVTENLILLLQIQKNANLSLLDTKVGDQDHP